MIGTTLSHYRILEELGRGGMGIVYKAEDTKLDRTVAIKVLPASALTSESDRARFYREAKSAAALNHPHIAQIYQIDEAVPEGGSAEEPRPFIALEYIDGRTLDARVEEGPLPLDEAVRLTTQIAQALEVAHEKDIVHRDIKAANVMLTKKGEAKVLDFGLAKTAHSTMLTRMGSTLGTVAYMSPEQARGEEVDGRTDLWALGVLLYQLIAGKLPFGGDYEQAVTYSILNGDPTPLTAIRTGVPMGLEWVVSKLLAKKADDRYQSARDLIVDLRTVDLTQQGMSRTTTVHSTVAAAAPAGPLKRNPLDLTGRMHPALIVFVLAGAAAGWWFTRTAPPTAGLSQQFDINLSDVYNSIYLEASADGRYLAFEGQDSTLQGYQTYVYDTTTRAIRVLMRNAGRRFIFSPDGTRLAYQQGRMIYTIATQGGTSTPVGTYGSGLPIFTRDGSILLDRNESIWVHPGGGPDSRQVSQVDSLGGEGGHYNGWPLPDGRHVLMHVTRTTGEGRQLALLDMEKGTHRMLGPGASPRYYGSGHVMYVDGTSSSSGQLLLRPFDADKLDWSGPPVVLAENGGIGQMVTDDRGTLYSTLTEDGFTGRASSFVQDSYMALQGDSRSETPLPPTGFFVYHSVSADGRNMAYSTDIDQNGLGDYVSVLDAETGVSQRLNINGDSNYSAWSADGKTLYVELDSNLQIWDVATMTLQRTIEPREALASFTVSPDGKRVVYVNHSSQSNGNLRLLDLETGEDTQLLEGGFLEPRFSPDGNYLIVADISVRLLVYSFADGSIRPITRDGERSRSAVWSQNGYIYFLTGTQLRRVRVSTDTGFRVLNQPENVATYQSMGRIDMADDGTIVALISAQQDPNGDFEIPGPLTIQVTTNWFDV
ncbi:MAG: protein kinase, partial [Bacteroidetes bacterium]|nr:protein kinase [Bacteroidota bacterium]